MRDVSHKLPAKKFFCGALSPNAAMLRGQRRRKFRNDIISANLSEEARLVRKIFLVVLLASFVAYAGFNLADSVTPYVTIAEARASSSGVQVKGLLDKNFVPQQIGD